MYELFDLVAQGGCDRVFGMCEKNSSRPAGVRERYFHLGARDRKVAREPESGGQGRARFVRGHFSRDEPATSRNQKPKSDYQCLPRASGCFIIIAI